MEVTVVAPLRGRPGECDGVRDLCHTLDDRFGDWELILTSNRQETCDAVLEATGNRVAVIKDRTHSRALHRALETSRGSVVVTCELDMARTSEVVSELNEALTRNEAPDVVLATGPTLPATRSLGEQLVRVALRQRFRNPLTTVRGYRAEAAKELASRAQGSDVESSMLTSALKSKFDVDEVLLNEADRIEDSSANERGLLRCVRLAMRSRPSFFFCGFGILTLLVGLVGVTTLGIRNLGSVPPLYLTAAFGVVTVAGMQIAGLSFLVDKLSLRHFRRPKVARVVSSHR